MGYTTDFDGRVEIVPPLNEAEAAYLHKFNETRRMRRTNGPYFVAGSGFYGQGQDGDIRDYNEPPEGQPGLWCKWAPTEDLAGLEWDGGEKFYYADEWMQYLIDHFLRPDALAEQTGDPSFAGFTFDHVVNGIIEAQGEDPNDRWRLVVKDNVVSKVKAIVTWPDYPGPIITWPDDA